MTITIKRSTAAVLIGFVGILGGLAIGQVSQALSADPGAQASYTSPFEKTLTKINKTVGKLNTTVTTLNTEVDEIHTAVGTSAGVYHMLDELKKITGNTYGTCKEVGAFGCSP